MPEVTFDTVSFYEFRRILLEILNFIKQSQSILPRIIMAQKQKRKIGLLGGCRSP
jgi:hypothetical protein